MNIMPVDDTGVGICPRCQVEPKVWPGCSRSTEDDMWICWKCVGDENWLIFHLGRPVQQPSEWPVVRQPLDPRWTVIKLRGLIKYEPDLATVVLGLLEGRLGQLPTAASEPSVGDWDRFPPPPTLAEVLQQLRDRLDDIRFGCGDVPAAQELLDRFDAIIGWPSTRTGGETFSDQV